MFNKEELILLKHLSTPIGEQLSNIPVTPTAEELSEKEIDLRLMEQTIDNNFLNQLNVHYDSCRSKLILENLKYIKSYCNKHPVFNGEYYQPLNAPYGYFWSRDNILLELKLSEKKFSAFTLLQEAISALGLEPQPTFEFIAFLFYHIKEYSDKEYTTCGKQVEKTIAAMVNCAETEKISMMIKVGSESFEFHNRLFIKSLLREYNHANARSQQLIEVQVKKRQQRIIQYSLLKTLLNELPYRVEKAKDAKYTQSERNFGLCVLYFCQLLNGEVESVCTKDNNATFDKLMRDFEKYNISFFKNLTL